MKKFGKFIVSLLCVALVCGCSGKKSSKESTAMRGGKATEMPMVKVQSVYQEKIDITSEYTATVEPFKTNNITTSTGNRIKQILVDVGSRVGAGQRLVILDDVSITTQQQNIASQEIALANQRRDLYRARELVKIGGGTQQAVDQLQASYDASMRALEASKRTLANLQENTVLTSPISGVVSAKNFNNGDLPGGPILVIQQLNPLKVVVNVNEEEFPKVRVGMPVKVSFDVYQGEVFEGRVHLIHPEIDQTTRTFKVEVTINNTSGKVSSGMFARVTFNYGSIDNIVVPDVAIQKQQGSGVRYVYVLEPNNTVKYIEVDLGTRFENRYEVKNGLNNGDKVVVSGMSKLADGMEVKVQGEVENPTKNTSNDSLK